MSIRLSILPLVLLCASTVSAAPTGPLDLPLGFSTLKTGDGFAPIQSWRLDKYKKSMKGDSDKVDLQSVMLEPEADEVQLAFDTADFLYLAQAKGTLSREGETAVWTYEDDKVRIVRKVAPQAEQNYAKMDWSIQFKAKAPTNAYLTVKLSGNPDDPEQHERQVAYYAKEVIRHTADEFDEPESLAGNKIPGPVKWVAALNRYFILAVVSEGGGAPEGYYRSISEKAGIASLAYPIKDGAVSISSKVYFGPKEIEVLRKIEPTLDVAVDFGWFTFLAYPMLRLLRLFFEIFHNYGMAIILLTVLIKLITFPLNYKAAKGTQKMAKLQPQMAKLKEKFKDDMQSYNREVMALMKHSGANPMAGCFPILIQMPVFFALFRVLNYAVELYQAPFALWIHDLSVKDPYYVTPVLLTGLMYLQQKLTPTPATIDPIQKKMFQFLPIIFGATMVALPSGLTIYMLTNSVVSIIQQVWMNKKLGIGNVNAVAASA